MFSSSPVSESSSYGGQEGIPTIGKLAGDIVAMRAAVEQIKKLIYTDNFLTG